MAPKSPAPASSSGSSYASSSSGEEDEEVAVPSPSPAPKKSSSAPPKPSTTTTTTTTIPAAPQAPKPSKPSTSAAQATKPNSSKSKRSPSSSSSEEVADDGEDEEAESSGGDEEADSSSDSGDNRSKPPPPKQPQPTLKPTPTDASDSGSTEDSDSDPDSSDQPPPPRHSARVADPSIKPLASKPMDLPSKPKKPAPATDPGKRKLKALESPLEQESGKQKRQLFQRIWSEEDEIAILRGMVDYHTKNGTVPSSTDMDTFHDFVHKSLQMEVSRTQFADKVRRLKKKYHTIAARGKNPSFTKPHEQMTYELSKQIWGPKKFLVEDDVATDGEADDDNTRKRRKTKEEHNALTSIAITANEYDDSVKVKVPYPFFKEAVFQMCDGLPSSYAVKRGLELVHDSKAVVLEEKSKKLRALEIKNHLRRMDLMKETLKMIMDAIEKLG